MTDHERRRELLDRWSELAPDECRVMPTPYGHAWELHDYNGADFISAASISARPYPAAILHHALTCAARRGWELHLFHYEDWSCGCNSSEYDPAERTYKSPDLAVLAAYVVALEAAKQTAKVPAPLDATETQTSP